MTQTVFELESQRKAAEDKMEHLAAADRSKGERIKEIDAQHKAEVERLHRSARTSSRKQVSARSTYIGLHHVFVHSTIL